MIENILFALVLNSLSRRVQYVSRSCPLETVPSVAPSGVVFISLPVATHPVLEVFTLGWISCSSKSRIKDHFHSFLPVDIP